MINILFEDNSIIVCEKPAGIATQAGKITEKDMVSEVSNYLKKPAYVIHRLDKPVRGILVFAKTKEAAAKLNSQLTGGGFNKHYYALVEGRPEKEEDCLENYIIKDGNKAVIVDGSLNKNGSTNENKSDAKLAKLMYKVLDSKKYNTSSVSGHNTNSIVGNDTKKNDDFTLLDIHLLTGRFHQIRAQLSNIGCPINGDSQYGAVSRTKNRKAIGLTAYSLEFNHPVTNKPMHFEITIFPQQEHSSSQGR